MIEAFITWEDETSSTITALNWGELFLQINSQAKQVLSIDSHLIEEKEAKP